MKARILAALVMATSCMVSGQAFADEALAKSKNCMSCHAIDKKVVGPAYKDVAKKYAGDAKAADVRSAVQDLGERFNQLLKSLRDAGVIGE